MNNQPTAFFFQIQPIPDDTILFDQFEQQNIFYSYFQGEQNYYLFLYSQKFIDIDSIDPFIHIIQELDTKQRKIRSLRGFFLYALEIFERTNNSQILKTNLKPSFWRNLKSILRQNKKSTLLEFLFGSEKADLDIRKEFQNLKEKIEGLQDQGNSLHQKITDLQNEVENLKSISEASQTPEKASFLSEQSKLSSNQNETQNESYFKPLKDIPKEEIISIIQKGFQLNQEGKISLKKYYESKQEHSLFQSKGYKIKYETIRRTKLYQQLKF